MTRTNGMGLKRQFHPYQLLKLAKNSLRNKVTRSVIVFAHQFPGKDVLVKVILDLFIGYVDTQLFK